LKKTAMLVVLFLVLAILAFIIIGQLDFSSFSSGGLEKEVSGVEEPVVPDTEQEMREAIQQDMEKGFLILVNKEKGLAKEYVPEDLAEISYFAKDRSPQWRKMRQEAVQAFHALCEDALEQEMEIVVTTAYRSYDFQSSLYYSYVESRGQEWADRYSAKPGTSEHQTGLAADCSSPSVGYQLTSTFGDTPEGKWLAENAHRFGFIIRYPEGKEAITGYNYEPWHIRYVGVLSAEQIYTKGITLEEWLGEFALEQGEE
jgi:D-alanyl-D-alanine carboxypeptidase